MECNITKIWLNDDHGLVFQLNPRGTLKWGKKVFLTISHKSKALVVSQKKPENLSFKNPMVEKLRTFGASCKLRSIVKDDDGHLWFALNHERRLYLLLTKDRELNLLLDQRSIVRLVGPKSYTKAKDTEWTFPENLPSCLGEVLNQLEPSSTEHNPAEAITGSKSQRELVKRLRRRLRTIRKSYDKLQKSWLSEVDRRLAQAAAEYLSSQTALTPTIEVEIDDQLIEVEVDVERSVGENVNHFYNRAKKIKRGLAEQEFQKKKLEDSRISLETLIEHLVQNSVEVDELRKIEAQFGLRVKQERPKKQDESGAQPFKVFVAENIKIKVGKSARDNDLLTKSARANDFWLHAVEGQKGAHVIVAGDKFRAPKTLPESIKREAAILAIHYSSRKADMAGEVYFTRKQNVKKKKGLAIGLWLVEKSEIYFVRYQDAELKAVMDKMQS